LRIEGPPEISDGDAGNLISTDNRHHLGRNNSTIVCLKRCIQADDHASGVAPAIADPIDRSVSKRNGQVRFPKSGAATVVTFDDIELQHQVGFELRGIIGPDASDGLSHEPEFPQLDIGMASRTRPLHARSYPAYP
jgi:hypothetical protein